MKLRSVTGVVLLAAMSLALAGCSREKIDWKSAEAADSQEGYNHFLQLHPDSALATQAHTRLEQLAEDKDWQHASAADTADAYKQFLAQHTSGKWAEEARIRMENFTLDSNSSTVTAPSADTGATAAKATLGAAAQPSAHAASSSATAHAGEAATAAPHNTPPAAAKAVTPPPPHAAEKPTLVTHTSGPPSKPITTASVETANFGIQLGAFSSQAAALTEWKRLQTTYDPELHGLFAHAVPVQVTSGKLYRLQSPVGEEARARSICSSLTKHSQPCVVVLPPENH